MGGCWFWPCGAFLPPRRVHSSPHSCPGAVWLGSTPHPTPLLQESWTETPIESPPAGMEVPVLKGEVWFPMSSSWAWSPLLPLVSKHGHRREKRWPCFLLGAPGSDLSQDGSASVSPSSLHSSTSWFRPSHRGSDSCVSFWPHSEAKGTSKRRFKPVAFLPVKSCCPGPRCESVLPALAPGSKTQLVRGFLIAPRHRITSWVLYSFLQRSPEPSLNRRGEIKCHSDHS